MWTSILGALALMAGSLAVYTVPKLIDAVSDRIRYGVQPSPAADGQQPRQAEESPAPAHSTDSPTKAASSSTTASKSAARPD